MINVPSLEFRVNHTLSAPESRKSKGSFASSSAAIVVFVAGHLDSKLKVQLEIRNFKFKRNSELVVLFLARLNG